MQVSPASHFHFDTMQSLTLSPCISIKSCKKSGYDNKERMSNNWKNHLVHSDGFGSMIVVSFSVFLFVHWAIHKMRLLISWSLAWIDKYIQESYVVLWWILGKKLLFVEMMQCFQYLQYIPHLKLRFLNITFLLFNCLDHFLSQYSAWNRWLRCSSRDSELIRKSSSYGRTG